MKKQQGISAILAMLLLCSGCQAAKPEQAPASSGKTPIETSDTETPSASGEIPSDSGEEAAPSAAATLDYSKLAIEGTHGFYDLTGLLPKEDYTVGQTALIDENTLILASGDGGEILLKLDLTTGKTEEFATLPVVKTGEAAGGYVSFLSADPLVLTNYTTYDFYYVEPNGTVHTLPFDEDDPHYSYEYVWSEEYGYRYSDGGEVERINLKTGAAETICSIPPEFWNVFLMGVLPEKNQLVLSAGADSGRDYVTMTVNMSTGEIDQLYQDYAWMAINEDYFSCELVYTEDGESDEIMVARGQERYYADLDPLRTFSETNTTFLTMETDGDYHGEWEEPPAEETQEEALQTPEGAIGDVTFEPEEEEFEPGAPDGEGIWGDGPGDSLWVSCYYQKTDLDRSVIQLYGQQGMNLVLWDYSDADWQPAADLPELDTYTLPVYEEGEMEQRAQAMGEKYGVKIYTGEAALAGFPDYDAEICDSPRQLGDALDALEEALSFYPEGYMAQLGGDGLRSINIYLCGRLTPKDPAMYIDDPGAFACTVGDVEIIAINASGFVRAQDIVHELTHVLDHWLWELGVLDEGEWMAMNPDDFSYYYAYVDENGESYEYTASTKYTAWDGAYYEQGADTVYFIDPYSTTYPTEDRARLMEFLQGDSYGTNDYFASVHLQEKLQYYFGCIRQAFDTTGWPEQTRWEEQLEKYE